MIRTITAEFQSIDDAEFAAKRIKQGCDGVTKVSINSKNAEKNDFNPFGHFGLGNSSVSGTFIPYDMYYYGVSPSSSVLDTLNTHDENHYNDAISQSVKLEIHCKNDCTPNVSCILHSMGGINIKKL